MHTQCRQPPSHGTGWLWQWDGLAVAVGRTEDALNSPCNRDVLQSTHIGSAGVTVTVTATSDR